MATESLDEGYWQALLEQGEIVFSGEPPETLNVERLSFNGNFNDARSGPAASSSDRQELTGDGKVETAEDPHEREWRWLTDCYERGELLTGRVIGCNRGGLLVRVGDVVGFVPASQLNNLPRRIGTFELRQELETMVGHDLSLRLIELDRERNRVILSERASSWPAMGVEERLAQLQAGDTIQGWVRSVCDFGAFVDIGGIDGLVHISEMSWQRIDHPRQVVREGQDVQVVVLNVDREQRRVGLSLKRLRPDPWSEVEERYQVGQLIEGVITNVVDFGAFVRIEEGLEGLIHISELAEGNFLHPRNVVSEGDVVTVRILNIDGTKRRLGLSLRQAFYTQPESGQAATHAAVGW
jgi:small subunit ribosomal protein S1